MSTDQSVSGLLRQVAFDHILKAILVCIAGIVILVAPKGSGFVLCTVAGILLVAAGVVSVVGYLVWRRALGAYSLVAGAVLILCGAFCFMQPELVQGVLTFVLGLVIVVDAMVMLVDGIDCVRAKVSGGAVVLAAGIVLLICGVLVMFGPYETAVIFLGWILLLDGILDLILVFVFGKKIRHAKKVIRGMMDDEDDVIDLGEM